MIAGRCRPAWTSLAQRHTRAFPLRVAGTSCTPILSILAIVPEALPRGKTIDATANDIVQPV